MNEINYFSKIFINIRIIFQMKFSLYKKIYFNVKTILIDEDINIS